MEMSYDPKYLCLCKMHVENGAKMIAFATVALALFFATIALAHVGHAKVGIALSSAACLSVLVSFALAACILYAQKSRQPTFYLPYIVRSIFWEFLICGLSIWNIGTFHKHALEIGEALLILAAVGLALGFFLQAWFIWIVWRAYKYMKDENRRASESRDGITYTTAYP